MNHIQLPVNILDRQWDNHQFMDLVSSRQDVTIHCRSIFLQGVLIAEVCNLPSSSVLGCDITPIIMQLESMAIQMKMNNRTELCLGYVKSLGWIDGVVMGVDNVHQLKQNIELFETAGELTKQEIRLVQCTFSNIPKDLLNPSKWVIV